MAFMRGTALGNRQACQHEMNRLFHEFFGGGPGEAAGTGLSAWTPAVDLHETDDGFVIKAELPGVSKDDVSVDVHQNTLTLHGQRTHAAEVKQDKYHRVARAYGTFQRAFVLPAGVDQEKVQATCKDGVLELHLPKSEAAKPRKITVKA